MKIHLNKLCTSIDKKGIKISFLNEKSLDYPQYITFFCMCVYYYCHLLLFFVFLGVVVWFFETGAPCIPGSSYVDASSLNLIENLPLLSPKCWDKGVYYHASLQYSTQVQLKIRFLCFLLFYILKTERERKRICVYEHSACRG